MCACTCRLIWSSSVCWELNGYQIRKGITMNRLTWIGIVAATTFLLGSACLGQQPPRTPEEVQKELAYYVGEWTIEGKEGDLLVKGNMTMQWSRGEHAVFGDWKATIGDKPTQYAFVDGWDSTTGWITEQGNLSGGEVGVGHWRKVSETLRKAEFKSMLKGVELREKATLEIQGADTITVTLSERRLGDEALPDSVVTYRRVVTKPKERSLGPASIPAGLRTKLDYFLGNWAGEIEFSDGTKGKSQFSRSPILEGRFHQSTLVIPAQEDKAVTLQVVTGWVPGTETFKDCYFGSDGSTAIDTWKVEKEGDLFSLRGERIGIDGQGRKVTGSMNVRVEANDRFIFQLDVNADGKPAIGGKAVWKRAQSR
jgi:hypothetical protein